MSFPNISPATVWELRPDGSDHNGGGYDSTYGGTDYSQQASPQLTITDLAHTSGGTTYTSATGGFTAAMVGNVFTAFLSGSYVPFTITGFTDTHTISAPDYGGSFSGVAAKVGGASTIGAFGFGFLGFLFPFSAFDGFKMWVRGTNSDGSVGSYSNAAITNMPFAGTQTRPFTIEGYSTSRGDGGMFTCTLGGSNYLTISASYNILKNAHIIGASGWTCGISITASSCEVDNILIEPNSNSTAANFVDVSGNDNKIKRVYIKPSTKDLWSVGYGGLRNVFEYCDFGSVAASINGHAVQANAYAEFYRCIFRDCSGSGFRTNINGSIVKFKNCNFWNNTLDGITMNQSSDGLTGFAFEDCIFGKNGRYDLNYTSSDQSTDLRSAEWAKVDVKGNWFFTTGTGSYHQLPAGTDDQVLSGDPFVSASTGNFQLSTTGAGAAVIASPRAIVMPDGSTNYVVAGAVTPKLFLQGPGTITTTPGTSAPIIDEVQFPTDNSEGTSGGPSFSTIVTTASTGFETRVPMWRVGKYKFTLIYSLKSPSKMIPVVAFFVARAGKARGFRFKDWSDFQATNEPLTVKGSKVIQLIKTYSSGPINYVRSIYKPQQNQVNVTLKRNGGGYATFTLDTTTGIVTLTADSTKTITGITQAAQAVVTATAHGFSNGDYIYFENVQGMTQINGTVGVIQSHTTDTFTVNIDSTSYSAYSAAGVAEKFVQPTETLTWSGEFDVPVRFDIDEMDVVQTASEIRDWTSVPLVEVLN